jgi:cellulose biosynthesis protein BcsQ
MRTVVDGLSLLPAMGLDFPLEKLDTAPTATQWREVFLALSVHADIVLVDTPAGVFGGTTSILQACTHVLGVLQAEVISKRSFSMFERALTAMTGAPAVVGVVINMFQRSQGASLAVFADATSDMPPSWVFDTTIPRSNDFLSSSDAGMPLRLMPDSGPSTITWLFDMLGSEVRERLHITAAASTPPTSFLLD